MIDLDQNGADSGCIFEKGGGGVQAPPEIDLTTINQDTEHNDKSNTF